MSYILFCYTQGEPGISGVGLPGPKGEPGLSVAGGQGVKGQKGEQVS